MKKVTSNEYALAHELVDKDVRKQVLKQVTKWGFQRHTYEEWKAIFNEEFAEFECQVVAAKEIGYKELTHVVAVGMAWLVDMRLEEEEEKERKRQEEKMFGPSERKTGDEIRG